jgi:hypothetical protein
MGRKAKPKTQLQLIDAEISATRKKPRTSTASVAKILRLRQEELNRLASLGIDGEAEIRTKASAKNQNQPTPIQQTDAAPENSATFDGLIREENEPDVHKVDEPDGEENSPLTEIEEEDEPKIQLSREQAMSLVSAKTSLESHRKRFRLIDSKGVAYGEVFDWRCIPDSKYVGKLHYVEHSTKQHLKFLNPETERWVDFDGRDVPSNKELARRQKIKDDHTERVAREQRERESDRPVVKIPRFGVYDVAKIWGPRSNYGLPELEPPQPSGQLDYSYGRLNHGQEQDQEIRRQVEADTSARMQNPWAARGD